MPTAEAWAVADAASGAGSGFLPNPARSSKIGPADRSASAPASSPAKGGKWASLLRSEGSKLLDGKGREVLLRGIAVIEKGAPYLPKVGPEDFARIRSWGMNSIRLGTVWAAIEPEKGRYDQDYLDALAAVVKQATDAGLYVIVDMHQDMYGEPFGDGRFPDGPYGDGAPAWTLTPCPHVEFTAAGLPWAANYFSPAVVCAFTNFWTSKELQAHYAGAWWEIARRLADNPLVAGYDLMNEPSQGAIPPGVFETQFLYPSQARWLEEIRKVDPKHIGFLESPNYKNVHLPTIPALTLPPNCAYAPHLYGFWDEVPGQGAEAREPLVDLNFNYSVQEAKLMGLPMWLGEFGMVYNAPGAAEFLRHVYDLVDGARAGAALWAYGRGTGYSPIEADGTPRPTLVEVARAYPSAVPGLGEFNFDALSSTLTASWSGKGAAVFAVPAIRYPQGIRVETDGKWSWDRERAELVVTGGSRLSLAPAAIKAGGQPPRR
ncbi:MAG: cellulase family glycosylhydrolase [Actinomycetota bacterium]